jgi:hypothetical protein
MAETTDMAAMSGKNLRHLQVRNRLFEHIINLL